MQPPGIMKCYYVYLAFLILSRYDMFDGILSFQMTIPQTYVHSRSLIKSGHTSLYRNGISIGESGKMRIVKVTLLMTSGDSELDPVPSESSIDDSEERRPPWFTVPIRLVQNVFRKDEDPKLLAPTTSLMDMQCYQPKGFVGLTMRVLRRRFFNLWSRSPSSWTEAVSQADPALPGTFVSRKRNRLPAATQSDLKPKGKTQRIKDAVQSILSSASLPVRIVKSKIWIEDPLTLYSGDIFSNSDRYSIQMSQSEQLGIFGRRVRSAEKDQNNENSDRNRQSSFLRFAKWIDRKDETSRIPSALNIIETKNGESQGTWGIGGYSSGTRENVKSSDIIDTENSSVPSDIAKAVVGSVTELSEKVRDGTIGFITYLSQGAQDVMAPHIDGALPFQSLKVGDTSIAPVNKIGPDRTLPIISSTSRASSSAFSTSDTSSTSLAERSGSSGNNPESIWRWMIPNEYIAEKMVYFSDAVQHKLWNAVSYSPFTPSGTEDSFENIKSDKEDSSTFGSVYEEITKTSSLMTRGFFEGTSSMSNSLIALAASSPWDTYYKGAVPYFENNNISSAIGGLGNDIYKGILGVGVSVGLRKDNVVSLVMEQDISDQSRTTVEREQQGEEEEMDNTEQIMVVKNAYIDTAKEASTALEVITTPNQGKNRIRVSGGRIKDVVMNSVGTAARNIFPVSSMLYGYAADKLDRSLNNVNKRNKSSEENSIMISKDVRDEERINKQRLRKALSATMRIVPILRVIPSLTRWSSNSDHASNSRNKGSDFETRQLTDSDKESEKEKERDKEVPFVHVHVGDSERFYDLWKQESKSESIDGNSKSGESSFPFDEEALDTVAGNTLNANRGVLVKDRSGATVEIECPVGTQARKEERALQSYDPSIVPSGRNKVPFPMMIGGDISSSTMDFIQQLRPPFFQNSNSNTNGNGNSDIAALTKSRQEDDSSILAVNQFARPATPSTSSSTTPSIPPKTSSPVLGIPSLNATFPFNFPFDSFRGFGGLTLPPATVRDISEISLTDGEDQPRQGDNYRRSVSSVNSAVNSGVNNDDVSDKLDSRRAQDLKNRPILSTTDRVPLPTKADLSLILTRRVQIAVTAALSLQTLADAKEYQREIGLKSLISAITESQGNEIQVGSLRPSGMKGVCRLIRIDNTVAAKIVADPEVVSALCDLLEAPLKGFRNFRSQVDKDRELSDQREAVALVQRIVRSSDAAVEILRYSVRLRKALSQVAAQGEVFTSPMTVAEQQESNSIAPLSSLAVSNGRAGNEKKQIEKKKQERKEKKSYANTTVVEYQNQTTHQMARVASWGLGGVQWKAKQPGQKGLRILSFDGGGTRGVLSIAMLKEIMTRISPSEKVQPYELFDIICGTSTGGIIAVLLGAQRRSVAETEALYDEFIDKVFGKKSNIKLVSETAAYDELELEKLLYSMCGDELLLDSNRYDCSRVFCLSTKVNNNPPQAKVWRNYNYPPGQRSRYPGAFRINTVTAVRATSAAPTFFTPVQWEQGLYCDGALVANNPTAIALQEAKVLYPGVPIELVVSIGTGFYNKNEKLRSMGWDLLVSQLIASSTDTEDVHALLKDFLPEEKYFRFNPLLQDLLAIDEKNKAVLLDLKRIAKETYVGMETGEESKHVEFLINTLRGGGGGK